MFKYLFIAFMIYLAYRLIFHIVIPIYRTTRTVKKGFREMQEKMNQHARQYEQQQAAQQPKVSTQKPIDGDYIDFEEVK